MSATADDIVVAENARMILRHVTRLKERVSKLDDQANEFGVSQALASALEDAIEDVEGAYAGIRRVTFLALNAVANASVVEADTDG